VQIHQKPNVPFRFDINGRVFLTDAQLIKFDRENLTAIIIDQRPGGQFTHSVFDIVELLANGGIHGAFDMFDFDALNRLDDAHLRDPISEETDDDETAEAEEGEEEQDAEGE